MCLIISPAFDDNNATYKTKENIPTIYGIFSKYSIF